jgi:hypothetical protein
MFFAFVGLVIVASSVGTIYGEVIGWLTLGVGIMVLSVIDGVLDRWDDRRIERIVDRDS